MEPLGAAASAIALVELAGKVSKILYKYLSQVKTAKNDIQRLFCEVGLVRSIIEDVHHLQKRLRVHGSGGKPNGSVEIQNSTRLKALQRLEDLGGENGPFKVCERALKDIMEKLEPLVEGHLGLRQKLMWPFESKHIDKIVQLMERQRELIESGLFVDQATSVFDIEDGLARVEDGLEADRIRKRQEDIIKWLQSGKVNPFQRQDELRRTHGKGTNQWVLELEEFTRWRDKSDQIFWINAIPGAGKSVICSTLVDHISQLQGDPKIWVGYYYFEFGDTWTQSLSAMLQSLIYQFICKADRIPSLVDEMFKDCDDGKSAPRDSDMLDVLFGLVKGSQQRCYIFIDALDECPNTIEDSSGLSPPRTQINDLFVERIAAEETAGCNFLFTSRKEVDIANAMSFIQTKKPECFSELQLDNEKVDADIRLHIERLVNDPKSKLHRWPQNTREEILDTITQKAQGMFRLAYCQLKMIEPVKQLKLLRSTLNSLPKTLEETYDRILGAIPQEQHDLLRKALTFIACSMRPVDYWEIAEFMVIDIEGGEFDIENRLPDPLRDIQEICSTLITTLKMKTNDHPELEQKANIEDGPHSSVAEYTIVKFAHASVREYLISARLAAMPNLSYFLISEHEAHREITTACLVYLLCSGNSKEAEGLSHRHQIDDFTTKCFTFYQYAAKYWWSHLKKIGDCDPSELVQIDETMKMLFLVEADQTRAFIVWVNIYHPDNYLEASSNIEYTHYSVWLDLLDEVMPPLHTACLLGLDQIVQLLLEQRINRNVNYNSISWTADDNPLRVACSQGYLGIVQLLLKDGAPLNAEIYNNALEVASGKGFTTIVQVLLKEGARVCHDSNGYQSDSALSVACGQGHRDVARLLLNAGGADDKSVLSAALCSAAEHGDGVIVQLLIRYGADIDTPTADASTPLYLAARNGHTETVRLLIGAGARLDQHSGWTYKTALTAASKANLPHITELLLNADANVRTGGIYRNKDTLLRAASGSARSLDMIFRRDPYLLRDCGLFLRSSCLTEAINGKTSGNDPRAAIRTLLNHGSIYGFDEVSFVVAAQKNDTEILEALLKHGGDPNSQYWEGSALHCAVKDMGEQTVSMLLRHCDIDLQRGAGTLNESILCTAIMLEGYEKEHRSFRDGLINDVLGVDMIDVNRKGGQLGCALSSAAYKGELAVFEKLIRRGAAIDNYGGCYGSPLAAAVRGKNIDIVRRLLELGADPNSPAGHEHSASEGNYLGTLPYDSAMMVAIKLDLLEIVRLLHEYGADPNNSSGIGGSSCLHHAISSRSISITSYLLEHGADLGASVEGLDPLTRCFEKETNLKELVDLLVSKGADLEDCAQNGHALLLAATHSNIDGIRILLDHGGHVDGIDGNCQHVDGNLTMKSTCARPLCLAIEAESLDVIQLLLDKGADTNALDPDYGYPLLVAIRNRNEGIVSNLLQHGADIDMMKDSAAIGSPLCGAITAGSYEFFELFLSIGADLFSCGGIYKTPLATVASEGDYGMALSLFRHGVKVEAEDLAMTLLAAAKGRSSFILKSLLDANPIMKLEKDVLGQVLIAAAADANEDACKRLLEAGADVNAYNRELGTPAIAAVSSLSLLRLFIEKGAKINDIYPSKTYSTPLQAASKKLKLGSVQLLVESGADINKHDSNHGTPLMCVIRRIDSLRRDKRYSKNFFMIINYLLEHGADPNICGGKLGTALCTVVHTHSKYKRDVIEKLLAHGAEINKVAGKYGHVLQSACAAYSHQNFIEFDPGFIEYLIRQGAHVNIRSGKYCTALHAAARKGSLPIVKLLLRYGADVTINGGKLGSVLQGLRNTHWEGMTGLHICKNNHVAVYLETRFPNLGKPKH